MFYNYSPSKEALEQLARNLVNLYPALGDPRKTENGYEMWFFNSPHTQGAVGFLEERLKNQRKNLAKFKPDKRNVVDISVLQDWESENEDGWLIKRFSLLIFNFHEN